MLTQEIYAHLIHASLQRGDKNSARRRNHFNGFEAVETANWDLFSAHGTSLTEARCE
jgi:hypothetical protein